VLFYKLMLLYFPDEGSYEMSQKRLKLYVILIKMLKCWIQWSCCFLL